MWDSAFVGYSTLYCVMTIHSARIFAERISWLHTPFRQLHYPALQNSSIVLILGILPCRTVSWRVLRGMPAPMWRAYAPTSSHGNLYPTHDNQSVSMRSSTGHFSRERKCLFLNTSSVLLYGYILDSLTGL